LKACITTVTKKAKPHPIAIRRSISILMRILFENSGEEFSSSDVARRIIEQIANQRLKSEIVKTKVILFTIE
jgi:hypothetical protein